MKLGLRPHAPDRRDLRLVNYFDHYRFETVEEDPLPRSFGHGDLVAGDEWGMLGNDRVGDCAEAGAAHETMVLGREGDHHPAFDDGCTLKTYSEISGYVEGDESTDTGTEPRQLAQFRRKKGILDRREGRHRIGAYLWLERGDVDQLFPALYVFGVAGIGYELPESAQAQFSEGKPWAYVKGSPIEGGHYVPAIGRRAGGFIDAVSWGSRIAITPKFYERFCQCGLVYVSASALDGSGKTPSGLDIEQLKADLKSL
jgi:hypothetical protein